MTVEIMSCAVPNADGGGQHAEYWVTTYATPLPGGGQVDERVQDANHALALARDLCSSGGFRMGECPSGASRIMSLYLRVSSTRRGITRYSLAFRRHAFDGMYNAACEEMMCVYADLKKVLRGARGKLKERRGGRE